MKSNRQILAMIESLIWPMEKKPLSERERGHLDMLIKIRAYILNPDEKNEFLLDLEYFIYRTKKLEQLANAIRVLNQNTNPDKAPALESKMYDILERLDEKNEGE